MRSLVRFSALAGVLGVASVMSVSSPALAADPDPNTFYIFDANYNGTGCPAGSVTSISAQGVDPATGEPFAVLSVTYNALYAQAGLGLTGPLPPSEATKKCALNFGVHAPQGFTYAVYDIDHRGVATLDPNVVGTETSNYFITGEIFNVTGKTTVVGAEDGSTFGQAWTRRDEVPAVSLVWATCGVNSISHITETVAVNNSFAKNGTSPGQDYLKDPDTLDAVYDTNSGAQLFTWKKTTAPFTTFYAPASPTPANAAKVKIPALAPSPAASGYMSNDSTDIKVTVKYFFKWKQC